MTTDERAQDALIREWFADPETLAIHAERLLVEPTGGVKHELRLLGIDRPGRGRTVYPELLDCLRWILRGRTAKARHHRLLAAAVVTGTAAPRRAATMAGISPGRMRGIVGEARRELGAFDQSHSQ